MSWNQTLRSLEAAARRHERESRARFREIQRQSEQLERLSTKERAHFEVSAFTSRIEVLTSIHKERGRYWNWKALAESPQPVGPVQEHRRAGEVIARRDAYTPGFLDKLLGKATKQAKAFEIELETANRADEQEFNELVTAHEREMAQWREQKHLAREVLAGNSDAYSQVLRELAPFSELSDLGSLLTFYVRSTSVIEVSVSVNADRVIPREVKSLTSTGRVSCKAMPKARFNEIYADYVAGCLLRIAREAFALLPLDVVLATAWADVFNSRTGHTENLPILSAALTRSTLEGLNFERLDPSDAIENFLHRGDFVASRKSGAFAPIVPLTVEDLSTKQPATSRGDSGPATENSSEVGQANPLSERWADGLRHDRIEFGFLSITANEIAAILGKGAKDNFTLPESRELALAVQGFGYCVEPDPRYGAGNYWGSQELGIFPPVGGPVERPSGQFLGASALLQLCLLVAAADGSVERSELDRFRDFIEGQYQFSPQEHQRLIVLETLLARNPAAAKVTLGRTAKRVPQEKHLVIAQFLVEVAAADSVISPKEYKALGRIFEALYLPQETLQAIIRTLAPTTNEIVIQEPTNTVSGEAIPIRESTSTGPNAFALDMSKVAAISAETNEVIGLLARAMEEPDDSPAVRTESIANDTLDSSTSLLTTAPTPARLPPSESPDTPTDLPQLASLNTRFRPVLRELLKSDEWTRRDFEELARRHQMMPFGLIESLNDWSNEQFGDQLLEGEECIIVHRKLLSE